MVIKKDKDEDIFFQGVLAVSFIWFAMDNISKGDATNVTIGVFEYIFALALSYTHIKARLIRVWKYIFN